MTRINLIPPSELSDQHLLTEYRELPRCIKQPLNISDAPTHYCLGKGHMKWARKNWKFLLKRFEELCNEIDYRGFKRSFGSKELENHFHQHYDLPEVDYNPSKEDVELSRKRINEKVAQKPFWYKWTLRKRPTFK